MVALLGLVLALLPAAAHAQIFKYVKPDGTVVYTDNLSQLPPKRRAYYNKMLAEQERAEKELEAKIRDEQKTRERAEARRRALRQNAETAGQDRLAALEAEIARLRAQNEARERAKAEWRKRYLSLRSRLDQKLEAYRQTQQKYDALAIRADYALFPGQVKEKNELRAQLEKLEKEIDALAHELNVELPAEARKAGIPPGWIR
jgi:colicin import membrane protein